MISGAMSALITPFKKNKIDSLAYEKIIQRQAKYGMDACVPVGTTGESATLSHQEHMECIEIAVSVCKQNQMKVLAGAGSNSTKEAIELAQFAQRIGADGILCVTPYYNKPTQDGLFEHYRAVAESVEIPMMLYNVPSRTGVNIETSTALRLFDEMKNIYGIKEATGNIEHIIALHVSSPSSVIASGDDVINYPILASGGSALISVTGNLLPNKISHLMDCARDGRLEEAKKINEELYMINKALFCETNPVPIKTAMYLAGLIETLEFRLPLVPLKKENLAMLEKILEKYEVLQ